MKKLTNRQASQLFNYLLKANALLNTVIDSSDDDEIGVGEGMEDISNLTDALKEKIDNTNWV